MLEGLLSASAEQLYCRLLRVGIIYFNGSDNCSVNNAAVRELVDKHFASWTADGHALTAAAPRLAIESALLTLERRIVLTHQACVNALASMPALQEAYEQSAAGSADDQRVSVIGEADAARVAIDLLEAAHHEVLAFQVGSSSGSQRWLLSAEPEQAAVPDSAVKAVDRLLLRRVPMRCIFSKEFLDSPWSRGSLERYSRQGLEVRATHTLPRSMIIVDGRAALVLLDSPGAPSAALLRHGAATDLLQAAFELHWARSVPLFADAGAEGATPSETQLLILRLLAAGVKDESIARHLRVSLRTVRRNVTMLCDYVGAPTRFVLATIAAEQGWIAVGTAAESRTQANHGT